MVPSYSQVAQKCDNFAITLLDKCTTKHEIQTLLQTKSYRGHHDANFNVGAASSLTISPRWPFWTAIRRLWRMRSSSSFSTRSGARGIGYTMGTISGLGQ